MKKKRKLRIGILDFTSLRPNFKRTMPTGSKFLYNAIKAKGFEPVRYDPQYCQLLFDSERAVILYKGNVIKGCDALIPRLHDYENVELEISFVKQFRLMGIQVINEYLPILRAMNKLRSLQIMTKAKIPVPKTIVVRRFEYLDEAIKLVGGYPVIIKAPFGTHGRGVAIIESRRSLYSALDILWKYRNSEILLIQEYIYSDVPADYRAFVIGDKVIAAMKRVAMKGDFRSNLHLGAEPEPVKLKPEEHKMAVKVAQKMGLDYCGVDILRSVTGSMVIEVNPGPGFAGITKTSGVNVPEKLIDYVANKVNAHT